MQQFLQSYQLVLGKVINKQKQSFAMQKLKKREIDQLKKQNFQKQQQYEKLLFDMINSNEQIQQTLLFSLQKYQQYLKAVSNPLINNNSMSLNQFTPSAISKLVFERHLIKIKIQFEKMPNSQCKLQHFLIIITKQLFINEAKQKNQQQLRQINRKVFIQEYNKQKVKSKHQAFDRRTKSIKKLKQDNKLEFDNKFKQDYKLKVEQTKLNSPKANKNGKQQQAKKSQQISKYHFDNYPFYLMAIIKMFKQIQVPSKSTISYSQFQKYIMGQIIHLKKESENTQFQIRFQQDNKQDFLLHDMGIRKVVQCKNLNGANLILLLDNKANHLKIYNQDFKCKLIFLPNKLKHNRKNPEILDIFFTDFNNSLGLVLADKTVSIVNFQAFITKFQKQFLSMPMNEIVYAFQNNKVKQIYFLQMANKWFIIGQKNQYIMMDCSKYRSAPQQLIITYSEPKNPSPQHPILNVSQIIALSVVCIVCQNQVHFYNQTMKKRKYKPYIHQQSIISFKYYQQSNTFYVLGKQQKSITAIKVYKNRENVQITSTIIFGRKIRDFQYFQMFNIFVLIDQKNNLRLIDQLTKHQFQMHDFSRIIKSNKHQIQDQSDFKQIKLLKLSKEKFLISESYMICLCLDKIAIQTQIQFDFLPYSYLNQQKQQLSLSFNNQILSISLTQGSVRQNYNFQNSNIINPQFFYSSKNTHSFIIDSQARVFDLYLKDVEDQGDNQRKKYKKKLESEQILFCTYDQAMKSCIIVSANPTISIIIVKNEGSNTFNTTNTTKLINFQIQNIKYSWQKKCLYLNCLKQRVSKASYPGIIQSLASFQTKQSLDIVSNILQSTQTIVQLNLQNLQTQSCIRKFGFHKLKTEDKSQIIIQFQVIQQYEVDVLLTDQGILYFVQQRNQIADRKVLLVKLYYFLAPKLRDIVKFTHLYLIKLKDKLRNKQYIYSVIVTSQQGFVLQLSLNELLSKNFTKRREQLSMDRFIANDNTFLVYQNIKNTSTILLSSESQYQFSPSQIYLLKCHLSKIQLIQKVQIQLILLLTVGKDGFLKLWKENKECIVCLVLPNLRKDLFNIREIQDIRIRRDLLNAYHFITTITNKINNKHNLNQILQITRDHQFQKDDFHQLNHEQPIKIQIQNKTIEDIINRQPRYSTLQEKLSKRYETLSKSAQKQSPSSLKKQRSFQNILQNSHLTPHATPIPSQLLSLRKHLHIYSHHISSPIQPSTQLLILPQLNQYKLQSYSKTQRISIPEQYDRFQACVFVKKKFQNKKTNQLDRIDKEFVRKEYSFLAKKNLAKRKNQVQITNRPNISTEKNQTQDLTNVSLNLQTILKDVRRIRYQSKYGGDRHIPKIKFKQDYNL